MMDLAEAIVVLSWQGRAPIPHEKHEEAIDYIRRFERRVLENTPSIL